jgi:predicted kinase
MVPGKVILICGKIGSGKSHYAEQMKSKMNALLLSCDELTQTLFPSGLGEQHDEMTARIKAYLYQKAKEAADAGVDTILEFGFWSRQEREEVSALFASAGVDFEWHYVYVSDEDWRENIKERNQSIQDGASRGYYVDEGLMKKHQSLFEEPGRNEVSVWYSNRRN